MRCIFFSKLQKRPFSLPQFDPERAEGGLSASNEKVVAAFGKIDYFCIGVFTMEILLRLLCTPSVSQVQSSCVYCGIKASNLSFKALFSAEIILLGSAEYH